MPDGKPIRLVVFNEDSDNTVYDAEMENINHKTVESAKKLRNVLKVEILGLSLALFLSQDNET